MRLDHVALATRGATPALAVLVGELGGTVFGGGHAVGYRPMQVFLGDGIAGMKVELLEPWESEANDFLERFIVRHGEGPHHLTFKVDDITEAIARVEAAGIDVTGVDLSQPIWREAFIAPRDAHGTVVQLAESSVPYTNPLEEHAYVREHGTERVPAWWTAPDPNGPITTLRRIVMTTPALEPTLAFFAGLLEGTPVDDADIVRGARTGTWTELEWSGGGRIRFEEHADRAAGIVGLELDGPGPGCDLVIAGTRFAITHAE